MLDINKIKNYKLFNADCLKKMKQIPDNSINLILCDPPYNLANYSTGNMNFSWRAEVNNDVAKWDEKPLNPADLVDEFKRIIKPDGNITKYLTPNLTLFNLWFGIKQILYRILENRLF